MLQGQLKVLDIGGLQTGNFVHLALPGTTVPSHLPVPGAPGEPSELRKLGAGNKGLEKKKKRD